MGDWIFGELEARLSALHGIADSKRTAFQARLKNLHRLGFPKSFQTSKGKAGRYSPLTAYEVALAVELVQLGMTPERLIRLLEVGSFPLLMSAREAARQLRAMPYGCDSDGTGTPENTFLVFAPATLWPLTYDEGSAVPLDDALLTFFCLRESAVARCLPQLTSAFGNHLAIINATSLLSRLAGDLEHRDTKDGLDRRKHFFERVFSEADDRLDGSSEIAAETLAFLYLRAVWSRGHEQGLDRVANDLHLTRRYVERGKARFDTWRKAHAVDPKA